MLQRIFGVYCAVGCGRKDGKEVRKRKVGCDENVIVEKNYEDKKGKETLTTGKSEKKERSLYL